MGYAWGRIRLLGHHASSAIEEKDQLTVDLSVDGDTTQLDGVGKGPIDAFTNLHQPHRQLVRVMKNDCVVDWQVERCGNRSRSRDRTRDLRHLHDLVRLHS